MRNKALSQHSLKSGKCCVFENVARMLRRMFRGYFDLSTYFLRFSLFFFNIGTFGTLKSYKVLKIERLERITVNQIFVNLSNPPIRVESVEMLFRMLRCFSDVFCPLRGLLIWYLLREVLFHFQIFLKFFRKKA